LHLDFIVIALGGNSKQKLISSFGAAQEGHSKAIGVESAAIEPEWPFRKGL